MKKWLIIIPIIFLLLGGIYLAYSKIFYPSYLSVYFVCFNSNLEDLQEIGYTVTGTFDPINETIVLYEVDETVWKHENIHNVQNRQNRLDNCSNPFGLYIDELEAYTFQNLPNWIYYKIYN